MGVQQKLCKNSRKTLLLHQPYVVYYIRMASAGRGEGGSIPRKVVLLGLPPCSNGSEGGKGFCSTSNLQLTYHVTQNT